MARPSVEVLRSALDTIRQAANANGSDAMQDALNAATAALAEIDAHLAEAPTAKMRTPDTEMLRKVVQDTNAALEQKLEELSLLRLVTDATSRAVRAADPFRVLLEKIVKLLKADNGSIMLVDWTTRQLVVRAASGAKDDAPHMPRFDLGQGVAGRVAESGRPVMVADVAADRQYTVLPGRSMQQGSLLCFPLVVQGQTIGVINLSSETPYTFSTETTRIAHIVAGQLAVAIENSRLYDEIKETKDYLENLVERAGAAIFTLDAHGLLASWNAGARDMLELPAREVLGRGVEAFIAAADLSAVRNGADVVLHEGGVMHLQVQCQQGDGGALTVDLTLSPIRDSRGKIVGVSGIGKDISEQKRVEEELRSLNKAKSDFIAMVSHELRTPLTSVKSFVEIMIDESMPTPEPTRLRYLRIINEECDRLDNLISDLLNLQKAESGLIDHRQDRILLANVVRQAAELYAPVANRQAIALTVDVRDTTPPGEVQGDRDKLYQVLGNLLNNALKFTPSGGRIRVQQDTLADEVLITVSDTGPGLPEGELEKVFERFYQVDNIMTRHVEGSGLGLAICRDIITAHNGHIWADSRPEGGALFGIRLPRL